MASLLTTANPFILSHQSQDPSSLAARSPLTHSKHLIRLSSLRVSAVAQKWEPSKVLPQADRVLIRLEELPEKSVGGVLLPKSAVKFERYLMGEILSVGGDVGVGELEAGKKVLFSDINAYDKQGYLTSEQWPSINENLQNREGFPGMLIYLLMGATCGRLIPVF
ncbi:hypothetical protein KSP39_PZI018836 [Platanthera zijinensis]|uniref:Uncharacterized protein n=1 Tax=Platanthera zijinensis TaxID=2320716 RepID=A0AAP0B2N2_9ASPA